MLGSLGALLMLVGDLCLSVIPANSGDNGLFIREAYLNGSLEAWRIPLLTLTGALGMALCTFAVRAMYEQVLPKYRKVRGIIRVGGIFYLTSAGVLHFLVGSLADWTSVLAPILGREETISLIQSQYSRFMPAMTIPYAGMVLLILGSVWALGTRKTVLPRWMIIFHPLVWQIIWVVIPDIRQLCGAQLSTMDYVLSQGSGNAALWIWMMANAVWAGRQGKKTEGSKDE